MQNNRQRAILMFNWMSALILHMTALYRNTIDLVSTARFAFQLTGT
jgi:hypothetical protein